MPAPLPIRIIGDPVLQQSCPTVIFPDPRLASELAAMHATLDAFRRRTGFGRAIAAPQVGILKRVIAMNLGAGPFALINPRILWRSPAEFHVWDDCLSIPDRIVRVRRHRSISLEYVDEAGRKRTWWHLPPELSELVQHEIDHLDGILMTARADGPDAVQPISRHTELVGAGRTGHRLSLERIARAAQIIDPVFRNSPQFNCEPLSEVLGCHLTLKVETVNPIRSFKGRGADFFLLEADARAAGPRQLVCASAGNWGQALAYAARKRGCNVVVYASHNANPRKLERIRAFGATVRLEGYDFDAAKQAARTFALERGACFVEDGREPEIAEGAGSIAVELFATSPALDVIFVPLGNGALLNGIARWTKAISPATWVVGVCAEGAVSMKHSFEANRVIETSEANTIADGIAVRVPIPEAVAAMQGTVDEVRTTSDQQIRESMRLLHSHAGLVVEPAGAAGLAALLDAAPEFAGRNAATVLCGGNI